MAERMRIPDFPKRDPGWLLRAGMIVCALLALTLLLVARAALPDPRTATAMIGRPASAFTLPAAQGDRKLPTAVHYSGAAGRPTLLVFFNTLCVHCLSEISAAREASATALGVPLNIIFIDTPGENAEITGAYMARLQLDPPVLLDPHGVVAQAYGASYSPTITLVDGRGIIRGVWVGETSAATLSSGIHDALGAQGA